MYPGFNPPPVRTGASRPKIRPGRGWYIVPFLLVLAGAGLVVYTFVDGMLTQEDRVEALTRGPLPAALPVELDPGDYSIYHEYDGAHTDTIRNRPDPVVTVTGPAGPVTLEAYESLDTYLVGGREGEGLFTFRAEQAGTYQVAAESAPGGASPATIAVGPPVGTPLRAVVIVGGAAAAAGVMVALVLAIWRAVKRRRARDRTGAIGDTAGDGDWGGPPRATVPVAHTGPAWGVPGTAGNWSETGIASGAAAGWSAPGPPAGGPGAGWSAPGPRAAGPPPTSPGTAWPVDDQDDPWASPRRGRDGA